jgi:uncharacterized protein YecT (DUF1311 family)
MRRPLAAIVVSFLVLTAERSQAQVRNEDQCLRLQPGIRSPVEMARCTFDLHGSESALNSAVAEARAAQTSERRREFDAFQHSWVKYRDALCSWEAGGIPGSTGNMAAVIACVADRNRERTRYLRQDAQRP